MSDINRNCKECGDFVKDTHEGVPFVDGTAMCMDCFTEDYIHYGKKVLDAIERGGLFDEEVETSDEQWFDDPEWIEMNRGEPFDVAWDSITKAPFYVRGEPFNRTMSDVEEVPYIYSGGDISDNPEYWTDHLPDALGYALYGSAMPRRNDQGLFAPYDELFAETVGLRETVPTIWRVKNPVDFDYPLYPDPNSEGFREGFFDEGMEIERIPTDEVRELILDLLANPQKIADMDGNSAGWWFDDRVIYEHTLNALNRLKTGKSGQLDIPHEAIPFTQTAFTDDYGYEVDLDD